MQKISIKDLGPVESCDFAIDEFCVLTGEQASGKSTIAKAIFFFRTVKDDILLLFEKMVMGVKERKRLKPLLEKQLRNKFLQTFGSSWSMNMGMRLHYWYREDLWADISLRESDYPGEINYIYIDFSDNVYELLKKWDERPGTYEKREQWRAELDEFFDDPYEAVFIPAGRSLITLLTNQLNYLYSSMDDSQKRSIDYCTQSYIERIMRLKPSFGIGMRGMYRENQLTTDKRINKGLVNQVMDLVDHVLKGTYRYVDGEERLILNERKYVKLNYASSGQQESIWIFNIIFYYILEGHKIYLILEEPESHLYPAAQRDMAELIALSINAGNPGILTTHSPYTLGALNNLLYADFLQNVNKKAVDAVIPPERQLHVDRTVALMVTDGKIVDIMDREIGMIENETIDGISEVINEVNDRLVQIQVTQEN